MSSILAGKNRFSLIVEEKIILCRRRRRAVTLDGDEPHFHRGVSSAGFGPFQRQRDSSPPVDPPRYFGIPLWAGLSRAGALRKEGDASPFQGLSLGFKVVWVPLLR